MAKLLIKSEGFGNRVIDLKLGVNRIGRSPKNEFQIEHPTISSNHCELTLGDNSLLVKDLDSTNGTFINGEKIHDGSLFAGQVLQLGDVELYVETTEVTIAIPQFDIPIPAPPVVLSDGGVICRRHPQARVTHQCTHCSELLCDTCVTKLRRRGGKLLKLCSLCSHKAERIGGEPKKKRSLLGFLNKTVKMPFLRSSKNSE
ncbi:MAG TPA: FHA domain-containing protein [Clostridia bacterium]|nr:FHA domain-containing protein [Clostridia bacterium]